MKLHNQSYLSFFIFLHTVICRELWCSCFRFQIVEYFWSLMSWSLARKWRESDRRKEGWCEVEKIYCVMRWSTTFSGKSWNWNSERYWMMRCDCFIIDWCTDNFVVWFLNTLLSQSFSLSFFDTLQISYNIMIFYCVFFDERTKDKDTFFFTWSHQKPKKKSIYFRRFQNNLGNLIARVERSCALSVVRN